MGTNDNFIGSREVMEVCREYIRHQDASHLPRRVYERQFSKFIF